MSVLVLPDNSFDWAWAEAGQGLEIVLQDAASWFHPTSVRYCAMCSDTECAGPEAPVHEVYICNHSVQHDQSTLWDC